MSKIEILISELSKPEYSELVQAQDYPAIAAELNNKPLIPNPEPQQTIPKILSINDANLLFDLVPSDVAFQIGHQLPGMYERLVNAFSNNNRTMVLQNLKTMSTLLPDELKTTIENYLNQTELDPSWQAQIPGQSKAEILGITVNEYDIQAALNIQGTSDNVVG